MRLASIPSKLPPMDPLDALRALTAQAMAAGNAGHSALKVDAEALQLAKSAVVPESRNPPELADLPIFLDGSGVLTIAGVSLYS